ncbi:hypothetical protein HYDPIDRAFT_93868, partial [Hydnomerulius pinastri MD-312]
DAIPSEDHDRHVSRFVVTCTKTISSISGENNYHWRLWLALEPLPETSTGTQHSNRILFDVVIEDRGKYSATNDFMSTQVFNSIKAVTVVDTMFQKRRERYSWDIASGGACRYWQLVMIRDFEELG